MSQSSLLRMPPWFARAWNLSTWLATLMPSFVLLSRWTNIWAGLLPFSRASRASFFVGPSLGAGTPFELGTSAKRSSLAKLLWGRGLLGDPIFLTDASRESLCCFDSRRSQIFTSRCTKPPFRPLRFFFQAT